MIHYCVDCGTNLSDVVSYGAGVGTDVPEEQRFRCTECHEAYEFEFMAECIWAAATLSFYYSPRKCKVLGPEGLKPEDFE